MAGNPVNIASYEESFNIKVVRLVEVIDFGIKIVPIEGCMQKLEPAQRDPPVGKIWRPEPHTGLGMCDELREYLAVLRERVGPEYGLKLKKVQHESSLSRRNE